MKEYCKKISFCDKLGKEKNAPLISIKVSAHGTGKATKSDYNGLLGLCVVKIPKIPE